MRERTGFFPSAAVLAAATLTGGCVKPPEAVAPMPAITAPPGDVSDIDVTEHVKTASHQSPSLQGFDIRVVTTNGDARLVGARASRVQVDEAIRIARAADGTHSVRDELTIKK